jgi:hypothetical protein
MRVILAIALCLFFAVGCKKEKTKETPVIEVSTTDSSVDHNNETDQDTIKGECSSLGLSAHKPLAIWEMKNGEKLVVCPAGDTDEIASNHFKGWVNVYPIPANIHNGYIRLVDSEMPDWLFTFGIKKKSDYLIELIQYSGDTKITLQQLDCSKDTCKLLEEKCIELPKETVDKEMLKKFKLLTGKRPEGLYADETDVGKLLRAAIAGDRTALNFVLDVDLHLDGAAGSGFGSTRDEIQRLVDLKCIMR